MRRRRAARWLAIAAVGARMAGRGRHGLARTCLVGVALALCGFVLAGAVAFPSVVARQAERNAGLFTTPHLPHSASTPPLLVETTSDLLDGRGIVRMTVVATADGVRPPAWLPTFPAQGHTCVSRGLRALLDAQPSLADQFGPLCPELLGDDIAAAPDSLVAVTGGDERLMLEAWRGDGLPLAASSFGSSEPTPAIGGRGLMSLVTLGCVFVLAPAAALVAGCARVAARARERRLDALVVVGLGPRSVRMANAVESALVALVAGTFGAAAWHVGQATIGERGVIGVSWWGADATRPIWVVPCVGLVLAALAFFAATGRARPGGTEMATLQRSTNDPGPRWWRAWLGAALAVSGLGAAVAGVGVPSGGVPNLVWYVCFVGGFFGVAATVWSTSAPLAQLAARLVIRRSDFCSEAAIGGRLLRRSPSEVARAAAAIGLTMIIALVAVSTWEVVTRAGDELLVGQQPADRRLRVELRFVSLEPSDLKGVQGVVAALPIRTVGDDGVLVLSADCAEARSFASTWAGACSGGSVHRSSVVDVSTAARFLDESSDGEISDVTVDATYDTLHGGSSPLFDILVPRTETSSRYLVEVADLATIDRLRRRDVAMAVAGLADPGPTRQVVVYSAMITAIALSAATLLALAALVPTLAAVAEHTRPQAQLGDVGLSTVSRRRVALVAHLPALVSVWLVSAVGCVGMAVALRRIDARASIFGPVTIAAALGLVLVTGVAVVAVVASTGRVESRALRRRRRCPIHFRPHQR